MMKGMHMMNGKMMKDSDMKKQAQWEKSFPKLTVKTALDIKQEKALKKLMKQRAKEAKKTGSWPNYGTN
jgi:exopolysaccharide biosynthesis protein